MAAEKNFFLLYFKYFYIILKLKIKLSINLNINLHMKNVLLISLFYSDYHYNIYGYDNLFTVK